jgi:hypothetical protein
MNWTQLRPSAVLAAAGAGVIALGACSSQATAGTSTGGSTAASAFSVRLNPGSGATSSTPSWSTTEGCPSGHQGSAIFREVHPDGTTNSISEMTNQVTAAFSGTLQASIAQIQAAGAIQNGRSQQFVIICFSGPSGTGTLDRAMSVYITYSADGSRYTTSATAPS